MPFVGRTADSLMLEVRERVRDTNGSMHTATFVRSILTSAQQVLNAGLEYVIANGSASLYANRVFYDISTLFSSVIRVIGLRGSATIRDVIKLNSLDDFLIYGPYWSRHIGQHALAWTAVGRDVLAVYPAFENDGSLGLYYVKLTNTFSAGSTVSEFSTEQCGPLVTLTEAILLLRQRDLESCNRALGRLQEDLQLELTAPKLGLASPPSNEASA